MMKLHQHLDLLLMEAGTDEVDLWMEGYLFVFLPFKFTPQSLSLLLNSALPPLAPLQELVDEGQLLFMRQSIWAVTGC